eukprot:6209959-Pleurochrysis_carterae.AAC.3
MISIQYFSAENYLSEAAYPTGCCSRVYSGHNSHAYGLVAPVNAHEASDHESIADIASIVARKKCELAQSLIIKRAGRRYSAFCKQHVHFAVIANLASLHNALPISDTHHAYLYPRAHMPRGSQL